jgi:deoxyribonuclease V
MLSPSSCGRDFIPQWVVRVIAAIDVNYLEDSTALAAAIVFEDFRSDSYVSSYRKRIRGIADYVPGSFYQRELPCILALLEDVREKLDCIIIDGYVSLGDKPGLGAHLRRSLRHGICVIGVAKSRFAGSNALQVFRGTSRRPLYVTASGMAPAEAAQRIREMHGRNRIPTLLKAADSLARGVIEQHRAL